MMINSVLLNFVTGVVLIFPSLLISYIVILYTPLLISDRHPSMIVLLSCLIISIDVVALLATAITWHPLANESSANVHCTHILPSSTDIAVYCTSNVAI